MTEFAFDLKLNVAVRVNASTFAEAASILHDKLSCADANFGAWPNGDPIVAEVFLSGDVKPDMLFEVDGEEAVVCPDCQAIEGTEEWGTVGDGYDGYCPSCADKRENSR